MIEVILQRHSYLLLHVVELEKEEEEEEVVVAAEVYEL